MMGFRAFLKKLFLFFVFLLPKSVRFKILAWPFRQSFQRHQRTLQFPGPSIRRAIKRIVDDNCRTEFGRLHGFNQVKDLSHYTSKVPLRTYEEFEPLLQRQRNGEIKILVDEEMVGFCLSRENHFSAKSIPLTLSSLNLFQLAEEYLFRLALREVPSVARGACLTLFPFFQGRELKAKAPTMPVSVIAERLGKKANFPLALPAEFFSIPEESVRYYLLLRLTAGQPITILRASSPGTLIVLAEYLELLGQRVIDDLSASTVEYWDELDRELTAMIPKPLSNKTLALRLQQALKDKGRLTPRDIWPNLQLLISSSSGEGKGVKDRLADRYGDLPFVDVGCRTEEGIFSWPWHLGPGGAPMIEGQLLEFLPLDQQMPTQTLEIQELRSGQRYRPVITAPNGVYRLVSDYLVEVTGAKEQMPLLQLVGRVPASLHFSSGQLDEELVRETMSKVTQSCDLEMTHFTTWLSDLDPNHLDSTDAGATNEVSVTNEASTANKGWFARLFTKKRPQAQTGGDQNSTQALCIALEPTQIIEETQAKKIVQAFDRELSAICAAYSAQRQAKALGLPKLLILKTGTFSRYRRKRLMDGEENAHFPEPLLAHYGWSVPVEDVLFHM